MNTSIESLASTRPERPERPQFASIACGISGTRFDDEIVHQAATLAGPQGSLTLVAVTWERGADHQSQALLSRRHADDALKRASREAAKLGVDAAVCTVRDEHPADALLRVAEEHDLLAIGAPTASRAQGIAIHRTASVAVHRATKPLLLVRRPPKGTLFAESILLAIDGTVDAEPAAAVAAGIAAARGSRVAIAAPLDLDAADRRALARDAAAIFAATGVEPVFVDEHGAAPKAVAAAANASGASLVIIGSRGLHGLAALGSVSERVAHTAPCSVLIVHAP